MLQHLINFLYRNPRSNQKRIKRFGGYRAYRDMLNGQAAMQRAATNLPPATSDESGLTIYFLTGKKYLYQTLFCITSLSKVSQQPFKFILVDDGTFDAQLTQQVNQQLPGAQVVLKGENDALLAQHLPASRFPTLNKKREVYPHIKKLTDVHFLPGGPWKLVLDSDMLFWAEPLEIIDWLKHPNQSLHMVDCAESYGYSTALMSQLCGNTIPELLNVGAIGLNSQNINWANLERWTAELEAAGGATYYLEQALSAMLVAGQQATILDAAQYKVNPNQLTDGAVLHHYVDVSKKIYFQEAWKRLID